MNGDLGRICNNAVPVYLQVYYCHSPKGLKIHEKLQSN